MRGFNFSDNELKSYNVAELDDLIRSIKFKISSLIDEIASSKNIDSNTNEVIKLDKLLTKVEKIRESFN